jgi:hypothetical protein
MQPQKRRAAARSVLHDLRRVHTQLAEQVSAADGTLTVLDASGQILVAAEKEYRSMQGALKAAGTHSRAFRRRETMLRVAVALSVLVYLLAVGWILHSRLRLW